MDEGRDALEIPPSVRVVKLANDRAGIALAHRILPALESMALPACEAKRRKFRV